MARGPHVDQKADAGSGNAGPGTEPFIARTWKIVSVPRTRPEVIVVVSLVLDPEVGVEIVAGIAENAENDWPPLVLMAYWYPVAGSPVVGEFHSRTTPFNPSVAQTPPTSPGGAAVMAKTTVDVALPVVDPIARKVTVTVLVAVGVPEITPVFVASTKPAGSVPDDTE